MQTRKQILEFKYSGIKEWISAENYNVRYPNQINSFYVFLNAVKKQIRGFEGIELEDIIKREGKYIYINVKYLDEAKEEHDRITEELRGLSYAIDEIKCGMTKMYKDMGFASMPSLYRFFKSLFASSESLNPTFYLKISSLKLKAIEVKNSDEWQKILKEGKIA